MTRKSRETGVTRLWPTTLERLDILQEQGKIPRQIDGDAAMVDYIVDQWERLLFDSEVSEVNKVVA